MRPTIYEYIQSNKELQHFIRAQPIWYRKLSRNPESIKVFENEARSYYGKTFQHRLDTFSNSFQMFSMLANFFQADQSS
ncbi:YlbE-like family protein [Bacillus sp. SM2101]|uniref:YlbE-like family protein n=1 Tax=Bacillus sp. SM2101 TaxID=2805366 RepID=UPI001BDE694E|nr:YlbE-like family protein [Bacillus sp. SM2101]